MAKKSKIEEIQLDRLSARCGLLLAAVIPLLAVAITRQHFSKSSKPTEKASAVIDGSDSRLVDFCSQNIKSSRAFVLFQHGTCVVVDNHTDTASIKGQALKILAETAVPDARFVCTPIEDNNLIVSYTEPVFHLRFEDEMELHREEIEEDFRRFLTAKESADITPAWDPPFHAKVGLRSRARLLKDAAEPAVTRIIAPRGTEKTSMGRTASVSF